jgi:hypothetical protein
LKKKMKGQLKILDWKLKLKKNKLQKNKKNSNKKNEDQLWIMDRSQRVLRRGERKKEKKKESVVCDKLLIFMSQCST